MVTSKVEFSGQIDLINLTDQVATAADPDVERAQKSRLHDIMIILEHARPELQAAISNRLLDIADTILEAGSSLVHADIAFDEHEPRFNVVMTRSTAEPTARLAKGMYQKVEAAIIDEVEKAILARARLTTNPRWRVDVTATYQPVRGSVGDRSAKRTGRIESIWLKVLLLLLAGITVSAIYLYASGFQGN